jgi:hypothetical protein
MRGRRTTAVLTGRPTGRRLRRCWHRTRRPVQGCGRGAGLGDGPLQRRHDAGRGRPGRAGQPRAVQAAVFGQPQPVRGQDRQPDGPGPNRRPQDRPGQLSLHRHRPLLLVQQLHLLLRRNRQHLCRHLPGVARGLLGPDHRRQRRPGGSGHASVELRRRQRFAAQHLLLRRLADADQHRLHHRAVPAHRPQPHLRHRHLLVRLPLQLERQRLPWHHLELLDLHLVPLPLQQHLRLLVPLGRGVFLGSVPARGLMTSAVVRARWRQSSAASSVGLPGSSARGPPHLLELDLLTHGLAGD